MVRQMNPETIRWGHETGFIPPLVDLVEIAPLEYLGRNRLAEEGEVLRDPMGPVALVNAQAAQVKRVGGDRVEVEVDLELVRLVAQCMDRGLYDLVVELSTANKPSYGAVGEGGAIEGV